MIRKNKKTLIVTSLLTLLPMVVGLLLWDRLPDRLATHWGADGQPDGWSSLSFGVFYMPLILLAVQWLCVLITAMDPDNKERNQKMQTVVLWIIPVLSNLCCGLMYALALGAEFSVNNVMLVFLGLMFAVIGNYMPKCRMNSTMGIKIPWTYSSEENWNATHRFGGKVWFIGGILIALCAFLPGEMGVAIMLVAMIVLSILPMVYSYRFYRAEKTQGKAMLPIFSRRDMKIAKGLSVILVLVLIGILLLMVTGSIQVHYGETAFTIEASYYDDLTVEYAAIDSVEYREGNVPGLRTMGYSSARLLLGIFENEEFGRYTRYTYTKPEACVVVTAGENVLVLSGKDAAETMAIYDKLLALTKSE